MERAIPLVLVLAPFASPSAGVIPATPAYFGPGTVIETFEHVVNFGIPLAYIPFDGGLLTYGTVPLDFAFPPLLIDVAAGRNLQHVRHEIDAVALEVFDLATRDCDQLLLRHLILLSQFLNESHRIPVPAATGG